MAIVVSGLLVVGVHRATMAAIEWLKGRPEHRMAFEAIRFDPPPPGYLRGGAAGVLSEVRRRSGLPEELATLRLVPAELARAFATGSPWIEGVDEVRVLGHPSRVIVAARFRKPVAELWVSRGVLLVLDAHGVVLPADQLDRGRLDPLIRIHHFPNEGVLDALPGLSLAPTEDRAVEALRAGLKLAEFVRARNEEVSRAEWRVSDISIANAPRWLSLETAGRHRVVWGDPPGEEVPGSPRAEQKWRWLQEWLAANRTDDQDRRSRYLAFTPEGIVVRPDPAAAAGVGTSTGGPG